MICLAVILSCSSEDRKIAFVEHRKYNSVQFILKPFNCAGLDEMSANLL